MLITKEKSVRVIPLPKSPILTLSKRLNYCQSFHSQDGEMLHLETRTI